MLLPLLLITLIPGERESLNITDFVHTGVGHIFSVDDEDCPPPLVCDLAPAFKRAFQYSKEHTITPVGMRRPGPKITIPPGEFRLTSPITLDDETTITGAGGAGWGAPTVLRVMTSTHGIIVNPLAGWSVISNIAIITSVAQQPPDHPIYGVYLKGRAHLSDMWIRGFTIGVYGLGTTATNINGSMLEHMRIDNSDYAAIYLLGDNAGVIQLSSIDAGSNCINGSAWSTYFSGRICYGVMDYAMMGNVMVAVQSANYKPYANFYLRRTAGLGLYSENTVAPSRNFIDIDAVSLGGILSTPGSTDGTGFSLYGPRASALRVYGTAATGDTLRPEIWLGGSGMPPGTVLTLMPPQSGSVFPSYMALRLKMDTTVNKKGWRADLQNTYNYTAFRIFIESNKVAVMSTRTSTKVFP